MKRVIIIFLMLCLVAPICIEAKKKPFGNGFYWELNNGTLTISGKGDMPEFGWNGRKNFYKTPWSSNMKKGEIRKIVVLEGVTSISKGAFAPNPSNDESVSPIREFILPSSLKRIGSFSFKGLNLDHLIINEGVEVIEHDAFYGCRCKTISLPLSLKHVGTDIVDGYAKSWDGEIISLPSCMINSNNPVGDYGISQKSWNAYKYGVKDKNGKIILSANNNRSITKCISETKEIYYIVEENGSAGFMNSIGKWIIATGEYSELSHVGGSFLKSKKNSCYGIINFRGKTIVPTNRGYTSIGNYDSVKGTFAVAKKGYSGICDAQGREISLTRLAPTVDDIMANGGYASAVDLKDGSTKYYKVSKGGRYGLTDAEGKVIVPVEMDALESAGTGYLRYKLNGFWGLMNYQGKILIDTDRGYTSIGDFKSFNKRFAYTMNGYKGECDATGRQISKIKVDTPRSNTSVASSSGSSSSSNSSSNNSGNKTTTVVVEHQHTPQPFQQWQACWACGGMGTMGCDNCGGSGTKYIGDRLDICSRCRGKGEIPCNTCFGNKGQYITVYQ